ncbi:hypothetical protein [Endozoicomonas numazuensis]|uniref:Uncharacterized protein n=1 Tax=Endozoicomonas numazuensis TaxID=1137799 RepID=A0A081ND84_9GAMM|nr:hypothetical protein [Endozoicomonas numazuensis]KEQ16407.1 hypothetical protein GZ78_21300 [Endozoicomonas numazuensis]
MNPLQTNGLCRRSSLVAVSSLFISLCPLSHADFADSATTSVEAVFNQGIGLYGTVDLGKCMMRLDTTNENKIPAKTLSTQQQGHIKDVATSLNNSHIIRMTFDDKTSPTYVVRSENLRITPGDESGGNPGWIIREFRFTKGANMEADIQLSAHESWTWDCSDTAINITNELLLTPSIPPTPPEEL